MLRRGEIPRANAELYLVTVTPHESIALYWLPPRRSSAQRHECSSKRLVRHSYVALCGKRAPTVLLRPNRCGMGKPAPRLVHSDWTGSSVLGTPSSQRTAVTIRSAFAEQKTGLTHVAAASHKLQHVQGARNLG
jgi:hypothetical protein